MLRKIGAIRARCLKRKGYRQDNERWPLNGYKNNEGRIVLTVDGIALAPCGKVNKRDGYYVAKPYQANACVDRGSESRTPRHFAADHDDCLGCAYTRYEGIMMLFNYKSLPLTFS